MAKAEESEGSSVVSEIIDSLNASPTAFHAVVLLYQYEASKHLEAAGYERKTISEKEDDIRVGA
ncbi:unnamed protein product [Rhodiola kirilowii]